MIKPLIIRYICVFAAVGLSGWALLYVSQHVQKARHELKQVGREIAREQARIDVLEGEWSYLNSPERLEALAKEHLDLVPPAVNSRVMVDTVSDIPPLNQPAVPVPSIRPAVFQAEGGARC